MENQKVQNVKITNFKGLDSLDVDLQGRSVYVVGENGAGKSSFISAIYCALTGKSIPPSPIKGNAKTGKIELELSDFAVELEFRKKAKGKLEKKLSLYSVEDGEKLEAPRTKLDEIIGNLEFNPFEFMRMQPTPQLNYFCKVFGIKGIKSINDDIIELNELMSFDKKRLDSLRDQLDDFDPELATREAPDVSSISNEYREAIDLNSTIDSFSSKLEGKKEELEHLKERMEALSLQIEQGEEWLSSQVKVDADSIKSRLDSISEDSVAISEAKKQKALHDEFNELEDSLEKCKVDKVKRIAEKKNKISEFTKQIKDFDYSEEEGFTLQGLPFDENQNNTAAQIVVGLELGAGLLGNTKIARFDGSLLDKENLESVNKFAEEKGLQLFVELVDRTEKGLRFEFLEEEQK